MTNPPSNLASSAAANAPTTNNLPTRPINLSSPHYRSDGDLKKITGYPPKQSDETFLSLLTLAFNANQSLTKRLGYNVVFTNAPPSGYFCIEFSKHDRDQFLFVKDDEDRREEMMQVVGHPGDMAFAKMEDFAVHVCWIILGKVGHCDCVLCVKGEDFDG